LGSLDRAPTLVIIPETVHPTIIEIRIYKNNDQEKKVIHLLIFIIFIQIIEKHR
jgi:hypothetical protein